MATPRKTVGTRATAFGTAVSEKLTASQMNFTGLAEATGTPQYYVSRTMTGATLPNKEWVDTVANALNMQGPERDKLYQAAAEDVAKDAVRKAGFDLDLTKK